MHQPGCDLCDGPASIHETRVRGGVVKIRHLCRCHGLKLWREAMDPAVEYLARRSESRSVKAVVTVPPDTRRPNRPGRSDLGQ